MPNLILEFAIEGEKQMIRRLVGVRSDMRDWTPQFRSVGDMLIQTFKENIVTRGRTLGVNWPPLAPSTILEKKRLGFTTQPMIRTGALHGAFQSKADRFYVTVFNPVSYFQYHQSNRPRKKIPRRVMMKIDEKRRLMIIKKFQTAIERFLQGPGGVRATI